MGRPNDVEAPGEDQTGGCVRRRESRVGMPASEDLGADAAVAGAHSCVSVCDGAGLSSWVHALVHVSAPLGARQSAARTA